MMMAGAIIETTNKTTVDIVFSTNGKLILGSTREKGLWFGSALVIAEPTTAMTLLLLLAYTKRLTFRHNSHDNNPVEDIRKYNARPGKDAGRRRRHCKGLHRQDGVVVERLWNAGLVLRTLARSRCTYRSG